MNLNKKNYLSLVKINQMEPTIRMKTNQTTMRATMRATSTTTATTTSITTATTAI